MLFKLLKRSHTGLTYSEPITNVDGPTIYAHARNLGLEGIVSKRTDSPYRSGRRRGHRHGLGGLPTRTI